LARALFKNLVAAEKWEEASEIARRQVKNGAHIVDVCLQSTDRDEIKDIPALLRKADPQDQSAGHDRHHRSRAVELALTYCQGKSIINSINLEDGEEKFERVCPLARPTARRWSSAASTKIRCRRRRSRASANWPNSAALQHAMLTEKYGIHAENIIIDPLVFPCATGDKTTSAARWKPSKASG
jgi:5-methyltetrahydrofolate--homocysteine methyltransferase